MPPADLYFSCDIEADGPIPGPYSMQSFGVCVAGRYDGQQLEVIDPDRHTFYRELKPISDDFVPEAAAVSGLDRDELARSGADPAQAMADLAAWVGATAEQLDGKPVFVAFPVGFDFGFIWWYLARFGIDNPFGHGNHIDLKTLYAAKSGAVIARCGKRSMRPKSLLGRRPHTHNALDDAKGQADLLVNLMQWDGRRG